MKRTMQFVELPPLDNPTSSVATVVRVRGPGNLRHTAVKMQPARVAPIITNPTQQGQPMELIPVAIFEVDPDQEEEDRNLIVIPPGKTVESPNALEFRGVFMYPQGVIFFLFEEMKSDSPVVEIKIPNGG